MKVVVDTNIVFSGILNPHNPIAQVLTKYNPSLEFFSCTFLIDEIEKHTTKLSKHSGLSRTEIKTILKILTRHIHFIDDNLIKPDDLNQALSLLKSGDLNDTPFVALSFMLNAKLWTGDRKLVNHLHRKKQLITISTQELVNLANQ